MMGKRFKKRAVAQIYLLHNGPFLRINRLLMRCGVFAILLIDEFGAIGIEDVLYCWDIVQPQPDLAGEFLLGLAHLR